MGVGGESIWNPSCTTRTAGTRLCANTQNETPGTEAGRRGECGGTLYPPWDADCGAKGQQGKNKTLADSSKNP